MNLRIRPATSGDVEALARLATQLGYPSQPDQAARRLQALPRKHSRVLIAETDGTVVGWIQVSIRATLLLDDVAEIIGLVVDEKRRGQGIGRALLQAAERWAVEKGCSTILVHSNIVRQRAHEFYMDNDFHHIKTCLVLSKLLVN